MTYTPQTIMRRAERRARRRAREMQQSWQINYRQCLEIAKTEPMYILAQTLSKKRGES